MNTKHITASQDNTENINNEGVFLDFSKKEPIIHSLTKLGVTPIKISFYILLFAVLWRIVIPLILNMEFPPRLDLLALNFFFMPIIWFYYIWSANQSSEIFNKIFQYQIYIPTNTNKIKLVAFIQKFEKVFTHWIWALISFIMALIISIIVYTQYWNDPGSWIKPGEYFWYAIIEIIFYTLNEYAITIIVIREILINIWLVNLYKNIKIKVLIDHPDQAGGWAEIGKHSASFSTVIISCVVWVIGFIFLETLQIQIYQLLYLILLSLVAPLVFIMPIWFTHKAMLGYKHTMLENISKKINQLFNSTIEERQTPLSTIKTDIENLNNLRLQYKIVDESVTVWPIPRYVFRRVGISWLLPTSPKPPACWMCSPSGPGIFCGWKLSVC